MPIALLSLLSVLSALAAAQTVGPQLTVNDGCRKFNIAAVALVVQGNLEAGLAALRPKLAVASLNDEPACRAVTLHNWAAMLLKAGRTSDAEIPAEQSVALLAALTSPDDPIRFRPLQTLWFTYSELGEVARARQTYEALQVLRLTSPRDHAAVLSISAGQSHLEGRTSEAENSYLLAISAWEAMGSDNSVEIASLLCDLGTLYDEEKRPVEAETMLARAVRRLSSAPRASTTEILRIRNEQAVVHTRQGRWDIACVELKQLLEWGESSQLGDSLLKVVYSNYASVLQKTHQKKAARIIAARAAAIPSVSSSSALVDISALTNRRRP